VQISVIVSQTWLEKEFPRKKGHLGKKNVKMHELFALRAEKTDEDPFQILKLFSVSVHLMNKICGSYHSSLGANDDPNREGFFAFLKGRIMCCLETTTDMMIATRARISGSPGFKEFPMGV